MIVAAGFATFSSGLFVGLTTADFLAINSAVAGLIVLSLFTLKTNRMKSVKQGALERQGFAHSNAKARSAEASPQLFLKASGDVQAARLSGEKYREKVESRMKSREHLHHSPVIVSSFAQARELNVFFNWNGHSWDAHEVLGLPAGARGSEVLARFALLKLERPDAEPFLQAAVDAILKHG